MSKNNPDRIDGFPEKGERDDGGSQPVGYIGLLFGAIMFGALIVVFAKALIG